MQGYDEEKALAYITKTIDRSSFRELGPSILGYVRQAQALDLQYMHENDVLDAEGYMGDGYYDEDDALEYIVDEIVKMRGLNEEQAMLVACLVDAYMGVQDAYLRMTGLG